jgi:hypothetical protein
MHRRLLQRLQLLRVVDRDQRGVAAVAPSPRRNPVNRPLRLRAVVGVGNRGSLRLRPLRATRVQANNLVSHLRPILPPRHRSPGRPRQERVLRITFNPAAPRSRSSNTVGAKPRTKRHAITSLPPVSRL